MSNDIVGVADEVKAVCHKNGGAGSKVLAIGTWKFVGRRVDGSVKWVEEVKNTVVDVGLTDMLDVYFTAGTATSAANWRVGLTTGSPTPASGDSMSSHGGWTEWQTYDEASRQAWGHAAAGLTMTNSTALTYTSSSDTQTVGGGFLVNNATKGGTTGTLFNVAAFSAGNKSLDTGETVDVTVTITLASA